MTPTGPPATGDRALFLSGTAFTVSGNGSPAQAVVQVSDATFTGVISPQGGVTGFPTLTSGFEVGVSGFGKATFTGRGAALDSAVPVAVGTSNTGVLVFADGATGEANAIIGSAAMLLGQNFTGNGTLTITGTDSSFTSTGSFDLAGNGIGVVTVTDGGHLDTNGSLALGQAGLNMAVGASSQATLDISNGGTVHNELQTNLGLGGKGTINVSDGKFTTTDGGTANPALAIARFAGSEGDLNVSGTGHVVTEGEIIVGGGGMGRMTVTDQGLVESFVTVGAPAIVGFGGSADGLAIIDGPEAQWNVTDALVIGQQGVGELNLINGGIVFVEETELGGDPYIIVGDANGSLGTVWIADEFSYLDASFIPTTLGLQAGSVGRMEISNLGSAFLQFTVIGSEGSGELIVSDSGSLATGTVVVGALPGGYGSATLETGALWEVLGQFIIGSEGDADVFIGENATVTVDELISIGDAEGSTGVLTLDGSTATLDGNFASVTIGFAGSGELWLSSQASWTVSGNVDMGVVPGSGGSAYIDATSVWTVTGSLYVGGFATSAGGTGELEVTGTVTAGTSVKIWDEGNARLLDGGTIETPLVEIHGGLDGSGTIDATATINDGAASPGNPLFAVTTTGRLSFTGDYAQTSAGELYIELGGTTPEIEFDVVDVAGAASLDGLLDVSLVNEFALAAGQMFEIIDVTGTLTGSFTGFGEGDLVGNFGGVDLFITYMGGDGNDVVLFTAGNLADDADFDGDGDVDGRDFLIWQRGFGLTGQTGNTTGDANFDGTVDGTDLGVWQEQYGAGSLTASISVPEPGALAYISLLVYAAITPRRVTRAEVFGLYSHPRGLVEQGD